MNNTEKLSELVIKVSEIIDEAGEDLLLTENFVLNSALFQYLIVNFIDGVLCDEYFDKKIEFIDVFSWSVKKTLEERETKRKLKNHH